MFRRIAALAVAVALGTTACSGSDDPSTASAPDSSADSTTTSPTGTGPSTTTAPDDTDSTAPPSTDAAPETAATTTAAPTTTTPGPVIDVGSTIAQTTPTTGNPPTPLLAWEPVDGAAGYTVIVTAPDGGVWWAWDGPDAEVVLGGVDGAPNGPHAGPDVTWSVIARAADGRIIATSPERSLES